MLDIEILKSELAGFTGGADHYRYLGGVKITEGAKYLAETANCFWLLDVISSYQHDERLRDHQDFQVWKLKVYRRHTDEMSPALIVCEDGNDAILLEQKVEATDFPDPGINVWYQRGVIFLPSEY